MDALGYTYDGNQLLTVTDNGIDDEGFKDGNAGSRDYYYDANGNMIKDLNKGITHIAYNHLNLPESVEKGADTYIDYIYDAAGVKLAQEVYEDGDPTKGTHYIGEFIYEQEAVENELGEKELGEKILQLIQHEEGRIVKHAITGGWEYQYHLKDHLGNTRMTFTTKPKVITFKANYENDPNNEDDLEFFEDVQVAAIGDFNHTAGAYADATAYTHSQVLRSSPNSQIGSAITIPVGEGDKITASVFAKYITAAEDPNVAVTTLASALISAFTGSPDVINTEGGTSTINGNFGSSSLIGTTGFPYDDANAPKAYLNLMFLPENEAINLVKDATFSYDQITNGTVESVLDGVSNSPFDELSIENFVVPQNGYILVYVSNEGSLTDVYFDDLEIEINEHPVVQRDDYYPFGLAFNSYQRSTAKPNVYLFNGKELEEELDLGWYDYGARNYNPTIGRFIQIDPLANVMQENWSPYHYVKNNPIKYIDPTGMIWEDQKQADELKDRINDKKEQLANKKQKLEARIAKREAKGKGTSRLENRIANIDERTGQLDQSISDIDALGADQENTYRLASGDNQGAGKHGVSKGDDGVINIYGSNTGLHIHEIRHVSLSLKSENGLEFSSNNLLKPTTATGRLDEIEGYKAQYGYTGSGPGAAESNDEIVETIANMKDGNGSYVYPAIRQYYLNRQKGLRRSERYYKKLEKRKQ